MVKSFSLPLRLLVATFVILLLSVNSFAAPFKMRVNISAHVIDSSIANLKDTQWTLYKSTSISGADVSDDSNLISTKIQSFSGAIQSMILPVGQYILKAEYGDAVIVKIIKVEDKKGQSFLNLKMVFNLGALKLGSSLGNDDEFVSNAVKYVVRNDDTGKIVIETTDTSKTHYLNQGDYTVTADFDGVVVTDAKFKIIANNLNEIVIRHKVGKVMLNVDAIKNEINDVPPVWHIVAAKNSLNRDVVGDDNKVILLRAGDYKLFVEWGDYSYVRAFGMHPGQVIQFSLPNNG